jgi:anti-sigma factor RsiW
MQCEKVREQFADYVTQNIDEPGRSQLAHHLTACESCREEAEELQALWASLGSTPAAEPGPEMRTRFDVMLMAYKHGLDHGHSRSWHERLNSWIAAWWPRQPILQFGLALGLLGVGVFAGFQARPVPPRNTEQNGEITELRGELSQMRQLFAVSLMQQQSAGDRLRGVNWSYQLQQPSREVLTTLLETLMHDPSVNVRLATVDALRQFGDQPVVRRGVIEAMARQDSPMVQMALIDLAVDLREKQSVQTLQQMSQDAKLDQAVRQRAVKGLAELE